MKKLKLIPETQTSQSAVQSSRAFSKLSSHIALISAGVLSILGCSSASQANYQNRDHFETSGITDSPDSNMRTEQNNSTNTTEHTDQYDSFRNINYNDIPELEKLSPSAQRVIHAIIDLFKKDMVDNAAYNFGTPTPNEVLDNIATQLYIYAYQLIEVAQETVKNPGSATISKLGEKQLSKTSLSVSTKYLIDRGVHHFVCYKTQSPEIQDSYEEKKYIELFQKFIQAAECE